MKKILVFILATVINIAWGLNANALTCNLTDFEVIANSYNGPQVVATFGSTPNKYISLCENISSGGKDCKSAYAQMMMSIAFTAQLQNKFLKVYYSSGTSCDDVVAYSAPTAVWIPRN